MAPSVHHGLSIAFTPFYLQLASILLDTLVTLFVGEQLTLHSVWVSLCRRFVLLGVGILMHPIAISLPQLLNLTFSPSQHDSTPVLALQLLFRPQLHPQLSFRPNFSINLKPQIPPPNPRTEAELVGSQRVCQATSAVGFSAVISPDLILLLEPCDVREITRNNDIIVE